jgi:GNAT superfamily N-acetyltransferase
MRIELLAGAQPGDVEAGLADVLVDCVTGGASVGFLDPLDPAEARAWWHGTLADPQAMTWIGRADDGRIVGSVRLILAGLPNARHRAEVSKLLVHRSIRGRGAGSALMSTVEDAARRLGRTTLLLDTQTGSLAEGLYERRGWRRIGVVDDHALTPDGRLAPTTFFTKRL